MVEFMKEHIGEEFEGHISGLTEWGIYVELDETHIEGMSFLRDIEGDFFQFDEANYEIVGRSTGRRMTLGEAAAYYEETPPRGEFVLVVAGAEEKAEEGCTFEAALDLVRARMAEGLSTKDAVKQVAKLTGFAKNLLYDAVVK